MKAALHEEACELGGGDPDGAVQCHVHLGRQGGVRGQLGMCVCVSAGLGVCGSDLVDC